jgi:hypothetical protein
MADKINSAYRINKILLGVKTKNERTSTLDVWAEAFGIESDRNSIKSIKVSRYLSYLHDELEVVRLELGKTTFPEELYTRALARLEDAFSAANLGQQWEGSKRYLDENTMTSLAYWVAILPDEESLLSPEDLNEIANQIDELEKLLDAAELPPSLVKTIKNLVVLMRDALEKYPVQGVKALRTAATSAYGELSLVKDELKQTDSKVVKTLGKLWDRFTKTVDNAETVEKAVNLGYKANNLLEQLPNLF